jgi:hypothetical protein
MPLTLLAELGGTDYGPADENALSRQNHDFSPAGPMAAGTASIEVIKDGGGGFTITPLMRAKLARMNGAAFDKRILQGVIAYLKTKQPHGTNRLDWTIRVQDANIIGTRIGTPLTFAYPATASQSYGAHIAAIVTAVQNAYGGTPEAIDATSNVVSNLGGTNFTMPALEGGHTLNWYIDQVNNRVLEVSSGTVNPGYYYGVDDTAGAIFGAIMLNCYDANLTGTPVAEYSTTPTGAQKAIRWWERDLDSTKQYVRRQATWARGTVSGYDATADGDYPCPWSGGGWWTEPDSYDVNSVTEAQALIDADVAANANAYETIRITVDEVIHRPGDIVDLEIDLLGIPAGTEYRVVSTRTIFEAGIVDYPLTEITLGAMPRSLGRNGARVASRPIIRDLVPPTPPADPPTVETNVFQPGGKRSAPRAVIRFKTVNSASPDIGEHRLCYTYNGLDPMHTAWEVASGPDPLETIFPALSFPPGVTVNVKVQSKDLNNNIHPDYGPDDNFVAASGANSEPGDFEGSNGDSADAFDVSGFSKSVTGDGTVATQTTLVYKGTRGIQLAALAGTATLLENAFTVKPGIVYSYAIRHRAFPLAIGTLLIRIRWYTLSGVFISDSNLYNTTPIGTETLTEGTVTAPAGAKLATYEQGFTGNNVSTTAIFVGPLLKWEGQKQANDIGAGAVTNAKLNADVTDDPTWVAWDVETNPLRLYDDSGNYKGTLQYSGVADRMRLSAINVSAITGLLLEGGASSRMVLGDAAADFLTLLGTTGLTVPGLSTLAGGVFGGTLANKPGSPTAGQFYHATDIGITIWWNGTYWLGPEIPVPLVNYLGVQAYTGDTEAYACPAFSDYPFLVTRMELAYHVFTTNDGSNYWTATFRRLTSGISYSTVAAVDTSGGTNDTWTHPAADTAFANNPTATNDIFWQVYMSKTNSPGNAFLIPAVFGRKVYG